VASERAKMAMPSSCQGCHHGILGLLPCIRLGAAAAKRATSAVAARRAVDASCGMATVTEMRALKLALREQNKS